MPEEYFTLRGKPLHQTTPELSPCWSQHPRDDEDIFQRAISADEDISAVRESAHAYWTEKIGDTDALAEEYGDDFAGKIVDGFPELDEWASSEHAGRMLRAEVQNKKVATERLIKAIEMRVRGREIYSTYHCEMLGGDIRVLGRDRERRTVIYMCANNQTMPIMSCIPQILITIESAIKLSESRDSKICLVADMHNFRSSYNFDLSAFKKIGEYLGSVYADRMSFIMIVDFSTLVRMGWNMIKPLLNERTQSKISFKTEAQARTKLSEVLEKPTFARIETAFDINRDPRSTAEERNEHAKRTSICNVPLGSAIEQAG
jgi:hypothetical protein